MASVPPPKEVQRGSSSDSRRSKRRTPDPMPAEPETPTSAPKETRFERLLAKQSTQATQSKNPTSVPERTRSKVPHTIQAGPSRTPSSSPKRPRTNDAADTGAGPSTRAIPAARDTTAAAAPTSTQLSGPLGTTNARYSSGRGGRAASSLTSTEKELLSNLLPNNMSGREMSAAASSVLGRAVSIPDYDERRSEVHTGLDQSRGQSLGKTSNMKSISEHTLEQWHAEGIAGGTVSPQRVNNTRDNQDKRDDVYARLNAGQSYRTIEAATGVPRIVLPEWKADGIAAGRVDPGATFEGRRSHDEKRKQAYKFFDENKNISLLDVSWMTDSTIQAVTEWKRKWTAKLAGSDPKLFTSHEQEMKKAEAYALLIEDKSMMLKHAAKRLGIPSTLLMRWKNEDVVAGTLPPGLDPKRFGGAHNAEKMKEVQSLFRQGVPTSQIEELTGVSNTTIRRWKRMVNAGTFVIPETSASAGPASLPATASNSSDAPEVSEPSSDVLLFTPKDMSSHLDEATSGVTAWSNGSGLLR